jgi:hypothetical protein
MAFRVIRKSGQGSSTGFVCDTLPDAIASALECIEEETPGSVTSIENMHDGTIYAEAEIIQMGTGSIRSTTT